ncbi:hypothetical protein ACOJIV_06720 [Haloarcula sp. AONF1]
MAPVADRIVLSFAPSTADGDPWSGVGTEWIVDELRRDTYQHLHSTPAATVTSVGIGRYWEKGKADGYH